jgi:hypothetical protein
MIQGFRLTKKKKIDKLMNSLKIENFSFLPIDNNAFGLLSE